jgi:hypothetical protein
MTKEELKKEVNEIDLKCEEEKREVRKKYALANNVVKIGDIVKDHSKLLKVESIKVHVSLDNPCCIYWGYVLNKDGWTYKKKKGASKIKDAIYQCNMTEINGVEINTESKS